MRLRPGTRAYPPRDAGSRPCKGLSWRGPSRITTWRPGAHDEWSSNTGERSFSALIGVDPEGAAA